MATRTLVPRVRLGGEGVTERRFHDFVVDGVSLFDVLGIEMFGQMSVLGLDLPNSDVCDLLLLRTYDVQLAAGTVALYICAECGDYGCGVTTVTVARVGDTVVWRDFGYLDWAHDKRTPIVDVGPFELELAEYSATIDAVR